LDLSAFARRYVRTRRFRWPPKAVLAVPTP
jgi:hypothetical protein